ncbi:MAG: SBBP repeat-containing protein [Dyadobacter fermentans]
MKRIFTYILLTSLAVACQVDMPQKPVSRFKFTPENGCKAPCSVTFTSEAENAANIQWDFGDGTPLQSGSSVTHLFTTPDIYQVKLIAKGVDGGSSGSTRKVDIDAIAPVALTGGNNFPTDIVSDASGNIYISGTAKGVVQFGNGHSLDTGGSDDFFVAKYNDKGECQWLYSDGSTGDDHANALTLDLMNDVYVTGFVSGSLKSVKTNAYGQLDGFVAKLNGTSGKPQWFKTFGGPQDDQGRSLAFFQAGEGEKVYLTGTVEGNNTSNNIYFNRTAREKADGRDGFFVLVDASDGDFGQPFMITGPDKQAPETITVDDEGDAYLAGAFLESIQFPNINQPLTSVKDVDVFVAKWDLISKQFLWVRRAGSTGDDFAYDIVVDASRNVYVTGMHNASFEDLPLRSSGDENVYLAKWNTQGELQKAQNGFTEGSKDYHGGIAVTDKGNIVISGSFTGKGWFPMSTAQNMLYLGGTDIIVTEVDPKELKHTSTFLVRDGGVLEDRVNKICVTKSGYVYVAGWYYGSPTYKGSVLDGDQNLRHTFIARYKL